jgi:hypothetical protein
MEASNEQEGGGIDTLFHQMPIYILFESYGVIEQYLDPAKTSEREKFILTLNYIGDMLFHQGLNKKDTYTTQFSNLKTSNNAKFTTIATLVSISPPIFAGQRLGDNYKLEQVYKNITKKLSDNAKVVLTTMYFQRDSDSGTTLIETLLKGVNETLDKLQKKEAEAKEGAPEVAATDAPGEMGEDAPGEMGEEAAAEMREEATAAEMGEMGEMGEMRTAGTKLKAEARSTFRLRRQNQSGTQKKSHQQSKSQQKTAKNH